MDAFKPQQPVQRTASGRMPSIPSFNDFCSFAQEDMPMPELNRSWSIGSDTGKKPTPRASLLGNIFMEHVRQN
jgi:hypothetical protein